MNLVDQEIHRFHDQMASEGTYLAFSHDPVYAAEWHRFRHLLILMDSAMDDAGLMGDTRRGIIRHVLFGSPNEADAIQRLQDTETALKQLTLFDWPPYV